MELNKTLEENERNKKNQKILQDKQKEEDLLFLDEQRKIDLRLEQQREYLLNKIKNKSERFTNKAVQEKVDKIKRDQEEEEKIMIFYMNEKARIADEKEMDENLRRQQKKKK